MWRGLVLSIPAEVSGTLTRRPLRGRARAKSFGRLNFGNVAAGVRTLTFSKNTAGTRLTAGRCTLKLTSAAARRRR